MVENICGVKGNQGKPPNNKQYYYEQTRKTRQNRRKV
jgi:hypothetical protein